MIRTAASRLAVYLHPRMTAYVSLSASCALGWFLTDSNGSLTTNFALLFQDLNLSTERLTSNKAFTNKLWNAGKFVLQNLPSQSDISAWETILACKVCVFAHF